MPIQKFSHSFPPGGNASSFSLPDATATSDFKKTNLYFKGLGRGIYRWIATIKLSDVGTGISFNIDLPSDLIEVTSTSGQDVIIGKVLSPDLSIQDFAVELIAISGFLDGSSVLLLVES